MGIMKTPDGEHVGRQSASIVPEYDIRYKKTREKKWYVYNKGEGKIDFSSDNRQDCENWVKTKLDLFKLTASFRWREG